MLTWKFTLLLWTPLTVTTTAPFVILRGTVAEIEVSLHAVTVAVIPPKVTVLEPCEDPKPVPVMTTVVPEGPLVGEIDVIVSPMGVACVCAVVE